jgi:heme/copper-type cytochrome/quinol oxidase subunit 2
MFTYKKGGVFEHYIIVGILLAAVVLYGIITNQNLLSVDNQSTVANIIQTTPILIVGFIFLVFLFVFLFYFITAFYIKLTKVEDKAAFYQKHTNKMITTAFIISFILILMVILSGIAQLTS